MYRIGRLGKDGKPKMSICEVLPRRFGEEMLESLPILLAGRLNHPVNLPRPKRERETAREPE